MGKESTLIYYYILIFNRVNQSGVILQRVSQILVAEMQHPGSQTNGDINLELDLLMWEKRM